MMEKKTFFKRMKDFDGYGFLKENAGMLIGCVLYFLALVLNFTEGAHWGLYLSAYFFATTNVFVEVFHNLRKRILFDENLLMVIATAAAFSIGEYPEAVAVMLLFQLGEIFQAYAEAKSRKSISSLLDIRSDCAHLITPNGVETVPLEQLEIGDLIVVKAGERLPLDGWVLSGESYLDTSALTGESMLRFVAPGESVLAGCINTNSLLTLRVSSTAATSTVARILEMVENASSKKADTEKFITKFARIYTPLVVLTALVIAFIPPLFLNGAYGDWVYRAAVFLLVSCPCALVISIPLGFFAGIGGASKQGVLVKGANFLEIISQAHTVVFDKTGTLTKGNFIVSKINPEGISAQDFLEMAAYVESNSNHPIANSIVKAYGKDIVSDKISSYEEIAGKGIRADVDGLSVVIGNKALLDAFQIKTREADVAGTQIHMAIDGIYRGFMIISDEIKETSKDAIQALKALGVKRTVMLTGDSSEVARHVASELGIDEVRSELLPHHKVDEVEVLLQTIPENGRLIFVGDGINDAPVLARADIGVAMGGIGSDAAIEVADVVLMKDDLLALVDGIEKSRQTKRILRQNILFALSIKLLIMILSIFGFASMWLAVFGDVGVTILAILNSIRALWSRKRK